MKPDYKHLTIEDRRQIYRLRSQNVSVTEIATQLGRHRSTIYREIQRNTFLKDEDGYYDGYPPQPWEMDRKNRIQETLLGRGER